jgi:two-component system NtrC family sensor kinase
MWDSIVMRPLRAFVLLSLPALVAIAILAAWYDRRDALRAAEDHVDLSVGIMSEHALKVFEVQELVLDQIALRSAGLDWDAISHSDEIASFLRETRDHMNQISSIWLVDSAGRVRASSEATYPRNLTFEDKEDFHSLREGGGMLVGKPHLGVFALTRRRSTTTGDFDGVFAIDVAIQYFEGFFQSLDEQARHRAVLVRADGTVLAADSVGAEPRWFPPTSELMQSIASGIQNDQWSAPPGIAAHFFRWRRLAHYPVYVAYAMDEEVALRSWYGRVVFYAILGAAIWAGLCLIAYFASRRAVAEAALQKSRRMEDIGRLASGIAHDFNNLLTAVVGNVDRVVRDQQATQPIRQRAKAALDAAMRAAGLTSQLLAFARRQPVSPTVVRIDDRFEAMLPLIRDAVGEAISVSPRFDSDLWAVRIDPGQFDAALLNLALNARDAMPRGGTLRVAAWNATLNAAEAGRLAISKGGYVVVEIADTGVGMRADVVDRAFEPFFSTKEIGKGSGLGLSMVYGFARHSGGSAAIESRVGAGTAIRLYLPRSEEKMSSDPLPSVAPVAAPRSVAILVVEDQDDVRQLAAESLEECGHEVKTARTAEEALEILRCDARIQVLLTDIVLPGGMSGTDLVRKARELVPELKVLTISGNATEETNKESRFGRCAFLPKPFRPSDLTAAVHALL